ncbi:MAG: glycoside hydrolase family 43 protein [Arachidicoccus sp.]
MKSFVEPCHRRILLCCLFFFTLFSCSNSAYLYSSFHEPANQGLRFLYSYDGYHWKDFGHIFLKPEVGEKRIMRDASILQGPDKVFRLVWTSSWKGEKSFGYASSKDLIHWSKEQEIPVMENEPTTVNVWAPELFYDAVTKQYIIVWASTVPHRFARGQEDEDNNHRLYYVTTRDFKNFSKEQLFFDPGFSSIDAQIIKQGKGKYVLVFKDNTRPNRDIKVAFSNNPLGPYQNVSKAFTPGFSEGPATIKVGKNYLIYFDWYSKKVFGAVKTRDFQTFTNVTSQIDIPQGHKHGTIIKVKKKIIRNIFHELSNNNDD